VNAQHKPDSIDVFIKLKMAQSNIPGLQLAIVRNGKIDKLKNYGFVSLEHQVATSSGTTFSINSMTKAFVGVAIIISKKIIFHFIQVELHFFKSQIPES